jgi:hypothetical protein
MSDKVSTGPATEFTGPGSMQQGPPEQGDGPEVYQLVIEDMLERAEFGARKYGHALRATADIDPLVNAYQESLDLCIYLRHAIYQRDNVGEKKAIYRGRTGRAVIDREELLGARIARDTPITTLQLPELDSPENL